MSSIRCILLCLAWRLISIVFYFFFLFAMPSIDFKFIKTLFVFSLFHDLNFNLLAVNSQKLCLYFLYSMISISVYWASVG